MFAQTVFVSLLLLLLGLLLCFGGFLLFGLLLPLFGFFAGFLVTAQASQELFGGGMLATVSSWVVAFVVGIVFAVAAYFFYSLAVAILAGSIGYELGVGVLSGLGVNAGGLLFLVGLAVAVAFVAAAILLDVPKVLIVALTAWAGAGMILTGLLLAFGRVSLAALEWGVVGAFIRASWFWFVVFVALTVAGVVAQLAAPARLQLEPYSEGQGLSPQAPSTASTSAPTAPRGAGSAV